MGGFGGSFPSYSLYVFFRASYIADDPVGKHPLNRIDLPEMSLDYRITDDFATGYSLVAMGKLVEATTLLGEMQGRIASATVKTVEEGLHEDELATSEATEPLNDRFFQQCSRRIYGPAIEHGGEID